MFILKTAKNDYYWKEIQQLISDIRDWPEWKQKELEMMRNNAANFNEGLLCLHFYSLYVRRFTHIICDILSKMPYSDDRFWRLATNLYDELGDSSGLSKAHGKLLDTIRVKPHFLSETDWMDLSHSILQLEQEMVAYFKSLEWPFNLFALGPGTESISDLFLAPIEVWTSKTIMGNPDIKLYFDVHRPEVESKHHLEIARLLADELSLEDNVISNSIYEKGSVIAKKTASYHLRATLICFNSSNLGFNSSSLAGKY